MKNGFSKYKTQAEVDRAIDLFIDRAERAWIKRDCCVWESPEYWKYHDIGLRWHKRAEALMPKSARSIK